ncbi:hypothetical protein ACWYRQ_19130 [Clostridioides difficile]
MSFEDIRIYTELGDINLEEKLNNPNWNDIIVPSAYLGADNIGEEFTLNVYGKEITFVIAAGYYLNVFHHNNCIVSKEYLQAQLGLPDMANTLYIKSDEVPDLEANKNPTLLPIQIAYYTGLRIGEVCGLTW